VSITQISLCYNAKEWSKLNEQIIFLMNRRGQSKKAQIEMIQLAMTWLPHTEEPHRTKLIETVRDVCAKKIFL
jgi:26S proteasome regulatory subunit N5